jgi:hypothetical protein
MMVAKINQLWWSMQAEVYVLEGDDDVDVDPDLNNFKWSEAARKRRALLTHLPLPRDRVTSHAAGSKLPQSSSLLRSTFE